MSVRLCPGTPYDIKDTQMILLQACGSDMAETEKFGEQKTTRHAFATERVTELVKKLLDGDTDGVDVLYCGKTNEFERIKDAGAAEAIARRTTLHSKITNVASGLKACVAKHRDYCNNNPNHQLTTIVILTSGKTSNHSMLHAESEGEAELRDELTRIADNCNNTATAQIRLIFAPVAPENPGKVFLYNLCFPDNRQKQIANIMSIIHPMDKESITRLATAHGLS